MSDRILLVDDEPALLRGLRRQLMGQFQVELAPGPMEGLRALEQGDEFAVVVSDMRMPAMNGIEFLKQVRDKSPDTVRMMLTGNADVTTAMEAVNEGNIFRFMTKPCPKETMVRSLEAGLEQFRLIRAERDLLDNTLNGTIRVLGEILSVMDPAVFGRSMKTRKLASVIARDLQVEEPWEVEIAAMLAELGRVTLPRELQLKLAQGAELEPEEQDVLDSVPKIGSSLIAHIPRLEEVARIVELRERRFDGSDHADSKLAGEELPVGARILKPLHDFQDLRTRGLSVQEALQNMRHHAGWYDPKAFRSLAKALLGAKDEEAAQAEAATEVSLKNLRPGMILAAPITTTDGRRVINGGRELTAVLIQQIKNYARLAGVKDTVLIQDPDTAQGDDTSAEAA